MKFEDILRGKISQSQKDVLHDSIYVNHLKCEASESRLVAMTD
jgi:hypothetical protein